MLFGMGEGDKGSFERLRRVLLVEDDEDIREAMTAMLESFGLEVIGTGAAEEAVKHLSAPFDLLVTDFQLPGMDGVELLNECRSRHLHVPVILLSARVELVPREKVALEDCCATLMQKPVNLAILKQALQAADARVHHADCVHRRGMHVGSQP